MRAGTGLVVAAIVLLAAVALADAVRRADEPAPAAETTTAGAPLPERRQSAEALRESGIAGVLTWSDQDCRLHALRLPDLEPARAPGIESCHPHVPSDGIGVANGSVVWAGLGAGFVQVVLSRTHLRQALAGEFGERDYRARLAVSLGENRYAVLVESADAFREQVLAGFDGERLRFALPGWRIGRVDALRPSPLGRYVALVDEAGSGVRIFTRAGRAVNLPALADPHAVAWSPDDRWVAVATRTSVWIFAAEEPLGRAIRLSVRARDLSWDA